MKYQIRLSYSAHQDGTPRWSDDFVDRGHITIVVDAKNSDVAVKKLEKALSALCKTRPTPVTQPTEQLLTREQLAAALGVCTRQVDRLREELKFPELSVAGAIRFRLKSVLDWLEKRSAPGATW